MKSVSNLFKSKETIAREVDEKLLAAAQSGYLAGVKKALKQGADIEAVTSDYGTTALMWAAHNGHVEVAQYLVGAGADIAAADNDGATALMWAAIKGHLEVAQYLVGAGADIAAVRTDGMTALMLAAQEGKLEVAQYLVGAGADIEAVTSDYGTTALMKAAREGHLEVAQYLVGAGADLEASNNNGYTALMLAAYYGHVEVAQYLVGAGADIAAVRTDGMTALMWAAHNGHLEVAQYLVGAGADIAAVRTDGMTALMLAAYYGHVEVAQYLVGAGADITARNNDGKTALILARKNKHTEMVQYLESAAKDRKQLGDAEAQEVPKDSAKPESPNQPATPVKGSKAVAAGEAPEQQAAEEEAVAALKDQAAQIDPKEMILLRSNLGNLIKNMATRDELSAVSGVDADIIAWYKSSYRFIQSTSELKDYYEAAVSTLVASFSSLQIQDAGIAWSDNAGKDVSFGSFLSTVVNEIPIAKSVVDVATKVAISARNYSQAQYAKNMWSHIGREKNMPLYASMLACGMTLVFEESLKSGMPDKTNTISGSIMKYCQSVFDEARGKMAQASALSKFADSIAAKDGVSDSLGLVRSMMCIESKGVSQRDRLLDLCNTAKQVRESRKGDSSSYAPDPFAISLSASSKSSVSVSPLIVEASESEVVLSGVGVGGYVSSEKFAALESELAAVKESSARSEEISARLAEESAKNKAELEELKSKLPDEEGSVTSKNMQKNRKVHSHVLMQGAHGEVSAASNPAALFGADAEAQVDTQERVAQMQAQMELMAEEIARLKENQGEEARTLKAAEEEDNHKQNLQELFS